MSQGFPNKLVRGLFMLLLGYWIYNDLELKPFWEEVHVIFEDLPHFDLETRKVSRHRPFPWRKILTTWIHRSVSGSFACAKLTWFGYFLLICKCPRHVTDLVLIDSIKNVVVYFFWSPLKTPWSRDISFFLRLPPFLSEFHSVFQKTAETLSTFVANASGKKTHIHIKSWFNISLQFDQTCTNKKIFWITDDEEQVKHLESLSTTGKISEFPFCV